MDGMRRFKNSYFYGIITLNRKNNVWNFSNLYFGKCYRNSSYNLSKNEISKTKSKYDDSFLTFFVSWDFYRTFLHSTNRKIYLFLLIMKAYKK